MEIPFLDLFHKIRDRFFSEPPQSASAPPPVRVARPSGDRRSKTVLPRPLAQQTVGTSAARSFASTPRARELPPALAKALEPRLERAISLQLSDFLDQIPAEYVKPVEVIDANRPVTLKASEIEKGMPQHEPSISLPSLYQQIPEIFLRSIPPTDTTRVPLPYEKVLEQFSNVQVRSDQQRDERVPQLETPILQATLEDTERFGTKMQPVESSVLPPVPVEAATAKTIASAEPEAAVTEVVGSTKSMSPRPAIPLSPPDSSPEPAPLELDRKTPPQPPSLKIPFQFPPNGTGASASERVPASSGPPVPPISNPSLESDPTDPVVDEAQEPAAPTEEAAEKPKPLPFKLPAAEIKTSEALKMALAAIPGKVDPSPPFKPTEMVPKKSETGLHAAEEPSITILLKPILENIPAFQRDGNLDEVSETVGVKFALDFVQSQLASGRVLVPAKTFQRALPPSLRSLFVVDPAETPVALPLEEVLKNLPSGALKMRDDQQKTLLEDEIVTPISLKAKEDAQRFRPAVAEVAKDEPGKAVEKKEDVQPTSVVKAQAEEDKIDGKQVMASACQLAGVFACELMFPDGLSLAGNLPAEIGVDGLCAMAPTLLQRVDTHMLETKLGSLTAMTIHTKNSAVTFFAAQNIYLAALHKDATALPSETQTELGRLVEKLSRTFVLPELPHVDH